MKLALLALACLLGACASPAVVTNKPDVLPVKTSNQATITHIKSTQTHIEASQKDSGQGENSLKNVSDLLDQLLKNE